MPDAANDSPQDPELIRQKLNHDTARIGWNDLREAQQQELVIRVSVDLDLIDVACQFTLDNRAQVQAWMEKAQVQPELASGMRSSPPAGMALIQQPGRLTVVIFLNLPVEGK